MASDALFLALANAKSLPSHALRAVESGAKAGEDIMGGYMQGKELQQKLDQYRLLSTPLGSMYSDPSQIPFGLQPHHTVKDLLTLAPAMENFVPANLLRGAAGAYGADVSGGGQAPPPQQILGASTPPPTPGTTILDNAEGAGAGASGSLPPGTNPPVTFGNSRPSINIPPGGMGMKGFKDVVMPALKAGQEERHFQTTQANEDRRQQNTLAAERNRTMAGETAKIAPNLAEAGTINDDLTALAPLYKGYTPTPFIGKTLANITSQSGSSNFGTMTMQRGKAIEQIAPQLAAKVNYLLNKRFNTGEAALLQAKVVPNASDDEGNFNQKAGNLNRLVAVMQSGDLQALQMVASAIAGRQVKPVLPSSGGIGEGLTGDPEADVAIKRISNSGLSPQEKQARINKIHSRTHI